MPSVLKPHHHKVKSMDSLTRKYLGRELGHVEKEGPGLTYTPPHNANPQVKVTDVPSHMGMAVDAPSVDYFNWADSDNVSAVKGWPRRPDSLGPYTQKVENQLKCGSCWTVSSASMLSDRFAIWGQMANPELTPTFILACGQTNESNGCNGGYPSDAADEMSQSRGQGTVPRSCVGYDWCSTNSDCNGAENDSEGDVLNQLIPSCEELQGGCQTCDASSGSTTCTVTGAEETMYYVEEDEEGRTSMALSDVDSIKAEIYANGPVVGCMAVFGDFATASSHDPSGYWSATGGVYCNQPDSNSAYSDGGMNTSLEGYHAVVIVGWGVERNVKSWKSGSSFVGDIPYWIVRNSWGDDWNPDCKVGDSDFPMAGHWKMAMSQTWDGMDLNGEVGIDSQLSVGGNVIGGVTTFAPKVDRVDMGTDDGYFGDSGEYHMACNDITGKCERKSGPGSSDCECSVNGTKVAGIVVGSIVGAAIIAVAIWLIVQYTKK